MRRLLPCAISLLALVGTAQRAVADDIASCSTSRPPDEAIPACTRLIASGKAKGVNLANLFLIRCDANYKKRASDSAVADCSEAIKLVPTAQSFWARAVASEQKRDFDGSIADASEAIKLDPKLTGAWYTRGYARIQRKEYDLALTDLDQAIRLNPANQRYYNNRAFAYQQKGDFDRALADIEEAIKLDPKVALNYSQRALFLFQKKDVDGAIASASEAIRFDPKSAVFFRQRAEGYFTKGDYDRSLADSNESIRLDPKAPEGYSNRSIALGRKGQLDAALADADEALKLNPAIPVFLNNRGFILNLKGDYDRALADLNEAIKINPNVATFYKNRGLALEGKGEFEKALADFKASLTMNFRNNRVSEAEAFDGAKRVQAKLVSLGKVPPETRVALVIGNSNYRNATPLTNPANDAADVAAALRRLGFEVVEGSDLDKRAMEDKIREFSRKLDGATLALFYYAGHGMQVSGKNYLIPVDGKLERPADLSFETVDLDIVMSQMEAEKRTNLIFLDACRNNPMTRSLARAMGTRSAAVSEGLASAQSAVGTLIGYATQPNNVALDGEGRNSPFTTAFLKYVATPNLEISALMRRVRADVVAATNGQQVPWDHSSLLGDVVLARQ